MLLERPGPPSATVLPLAPGVGDVVPPGSWFGPDVSELPTKLMKLIFIAVCNAETFYRGELLPRDWVLSTDCVSERVPHTAFVAPKSCHE